MSIEEPKTKTFWGGLIPVNWRQAMLMAGFGLFTLAFYLKIDKLYGLLLLVFFVVFVVFRARSFVLTALCLSAIVLLYTPAVDAIKAIKDNNLGVAQKPWRALDTVFSPNAGEEVLPSEVQQMLSMLRAHEISSYQISDAIEEDLLIRQRIEEAAWPIRLDAQSPYRLTLLKQEQQPPNCEIIDQREEAALEYCH